METALGLPIEFWEMVKWIGIIAALSIFGSKFYKDMKIWQTLKTNAVFTAASILMYSIYKVITDDLTKEQPK